MSQKITTEQIDTTSGFTLESRINVNLGGKTGSSGRDVTSYTISNDNSVATFLLARQDGSSNVGFRIYRGADDTTLLSVTDSGVSWKGNNIITTSGINAGTLDSLDSTQFARFNARSEDGYIWPKRNSTNPVIYATQQGTGNIAELRKGSGDGSPALVITNTGGIRRYTHNSGHLIGSYDTLGANGGRSNPIYTIGDNYLPGVSELENMYGIGYSNTSQATFINTITGSGWGLYVAANGLAKIFLNGSTGNIYAENNIFVGTQRVYHEGNDGPGSELNADLLDGRQGNEYVYVNDRTDSGYVWIRRGGGTTLSLTQQLGNNSNIADFRFGSGDGDIVSFINYQGSYSTKNELIAEGGIRVGANGRGDSEIFFYADQLNNTRKLSWNDSVSDWVVQDKNGIDRLLYHAGNFGGVDSGVDAGTLDGYQSDDFLKSTENTEKINGNLTFNDGSPSNRGLHFGNSGDIKFYFDADNNRLRIMNRFNDNLGILDAFDGTTFFYSNSQRFTTTSGGISVNGVGVANDWIATSDIKLKRNIKPLEKSLEKILQLKGCSFNRIDDDEDKVHIGLIAQEVEEVIPELVDNVDISNKEDKEENIVKGVKYEKITALLIESIKEQQKQIDDLKEQVRKLSK